MTLQEAIEIKEQYLRDNQPYDLEELEIADRLLIKAGKRVIALRNTIMLSSNGLLPGETEE